MDVLPPCLQVYAGMVLCRRVEIGQGFVPLRMPAACAEGRVLNHGGFAPGIYPCASRASPFIGI